MEGQGPQYSHSKQLDAAAEAGSTVGLGLPVRAARQARSILMPLSKLVVMTILVAAPNELPALERLDHGACVQLLVPAVGRV